MSVCTLCEVCVAVCTPFSCFCDAQSEKHQCTKRFWDFPIVLNCFCVAVTKFWMDSKKVNRFHKITLYSNLPVSMMKVQTPNSFMCPQFFHWTDHRPSVESSLCVSRNSTLNPVTDWEKNTEAQLQCRLDWSYFMMHWGCMDDYQIDCQIDQYILRRFTFTKSFFFVLESFSISWHVTLTSIWPQVPQPQIFSSGFTSVDNFLTYILMYFIFTTWWKLICHIFVAANCLKQGSHWLVCVKLWFDWKCFHLLKLLKPRPNGQTY